MSNRRIITTEITKITEEEISGTYINLSSCLLCALCDLCGYDSSIEQFGQRVKKINFNWTSFEIRRPLHNSWHPLKMVIVRSFDFRSPPMGRPAYGGSLKSKYHQNDLFFSNTLELCRGLLIKRLIQSIF